MYCAVTFTVYWQSMFHSLVAMVLILRTWTFFTNQMLGLSIIQHANMLHYIQLNPFPISSSSLFK